MLQWLRMMLTIGCFLLYIGALPLEERSLVIVSRAETVSAPYPFSVSCPSIARRKPYWFVSNAMTVPRTFPTVKIARFLAAKS